MPVYASLPNGDSLFVTIGIFDYWRTRLVTPPSPHVQVRCTIYRSLPTERIKPQVTIVFIRVAMRSDRAVAVIFYNDRATMTITGISARKLVMGLVVQVGDNEG